MREKLKNAIQRAFRGGRDESRIARRARMAGAVLEAASEEGRVVVHVWQMDCDCASWDSYREVAATLMAVEDVINDVYEGAEGPVRIDIISPSEVPEPEDRPRPRDHALEAYENGHPYSITY